MKPIVVRIFCTFLALTTGCASKPVVAPVGPVYDADLAAGVPLFSERVTANDAVIPEPTDVFTLSQEMRDYLDGLLRKGAHPLERARRLVKLLVREEFFPEGYYTETTLTAAQLFKARSGNCLSYTNLFVAMARYAGIDARFQIARIPATWSADNGYLVRSRHINVLVRDGGLPRKDWLTVDFNQVATSNLYPHRAVADAFALSSFYNNLAIDELYKNNYRASVALINAAIQADPYNSDAWVNLSAVYSRNNRLDAAIAALETARQFEPDNESALAGLVRLLNRRAGPGDIDSAAGYASEMKSRRERNPYFHFALAQAAYDQGNYAQSEIHANAAIDLRSRSGLFYYTRALSQYQQGKLESARASLVLAQERSDSLPSSKQRHALTLAERINQERGVMPLPVPDA